MLIYTCQMCGHQHEEDAPPRPGVIQRSNEQWCYKCGRTSFHFAARSDGQAEQQRAAVRHQLKIVRRQQTSVGRTAGTATGWRKGELL